MTDLILIDSLQITIPIPIVGAYDLKKGDKVWFDLVKVVKDKIKQED